MSSLTKLALRAAPALAVLLAAVSCVPSASSPAAARQLTEIYAATRSLAAQYPLWASVATLGYGASVASPDGDHSLPILALEIRAPGVAAGTAAGDAAPAVELVGCMHGDEQIGAELSLDVAAKLLAAYANADTSVTGTVARSEALTIVPVANPWGYNASVRTNAASVDLNRDFSWPFVQEGADPALYITTPETKALAADATSKHYAIVICLHSGAYCISLPWDYLGTSSDGSSGTTSYSVGDFLTRYAPSYVFFEARGSAYAALVESSAGQAPGSFPVVEGEDWYYAGGTYPDWLYGARGCPGYTVEVSPHVGWTARPASEGEAVIAMHEAALINLLASAGMGATGSVVDSAGKAITAKVTATPIAEQPKALFPAPIPYTAFGLSNAAGSFHIALPPGRWSLTAVGMDSNGNPTTAASAATEATVGADGYASPVSITLP